MDDLDESDKNEIIPVDLDDKKLDDKKSSTKMNLQCINNLKIDNKTYCWSNNKYILKEDLN